MVPLFFAGRLDLQESDAWRFCQQMIHHASSAGGVLTLLWHDRSHVPNAFGETSISGFWKNSAIRPRGSPPPDKPSIGFAAVDQSHFSAHPAVFARADAGHAPAYLSCCVFIARASKAPPTFRGSVTATRTFHSCARACRWRVAWPARWLVNSTTIPVKTVCILVQNQYDFDIRVRRKAESLVAAGYDVDVIALRVGGTTQKSYRLNGVNVCTVGLGKNRGSLLRYAIEYAIFFAFAAWQVSTRMHRRRYAIVDVNNVPDFLVFAAAWAKFRGAKVLFDMHEITPEFYQSKYGVPETAWLIRALKVVENLSMRFARSCHHH
jgi:hypothetical protein